ncbi:MAG: T9SS type A sorting domain-containing protein [Saprospiraceae bacterium]|nr:T9SS type A sorting domain-containing protein [Saprospiraceae bacterium]
MKNKHFFSIFFFGFFCLNTFYLKAVNDLTVADPRGSKSGKGSIDSASLIIRPKGVFFEHSLYLNFSGKSLNFQTKDTFEIVLKFDLPENAIVTDSWLWLNDQVILKGKLLDVWSAINIYENIVRRNRDPSLLRRLSATQYELRIFPMAGTEDRKVKITYLLPATLSEDLMSRTISIPFLQVSKVPLKEINLVYFPTEKHLEPSISLAGAAFENLWENTDSVNGKFYYKPVPIKEAINGFKLNVLMDKAYPSFYSTFYNGKDHYYQLGVRMSSILDLVQNKKILVIFDYFSSFANPKDEVLLNLEESLLKQVSDQNQIGFIFIRDLQVEQIFPNWAVASPENIRTGIAQLKSRAGNSGSPIQLLNQGLEILKSQQGPANILMVTSGDNYSDWQTVNTIIQTLTDKGISQYPINIADINIRTTACYNLGGRTYCNNQYLLQNLSNLTKGSYSKIGGSNTLQTVILSETERAKGTILHLDFYTKSEEGICINRFYNKPLSEVTYSDMVLQFGKFIGKPPFSVEISGLLDNHFFNNRITIPEDHVLPGDKATQQAWSSFHIKELEKLNSNSAISNIIYSSQESNVLSQYTAFLCLEDSSYFCLNCVDDTKVISDVSDDIFRDSIEIIALPNPFSEKIQIILRNIGNENQDQCVVSLTDMNGRFLKKLTEVSRQNNELKFEWLPEANFPPGIYYCVIQTDKFRKSIKLVRF